MHSYSIDRDLRKKVVVYIFIISIILSYALNVIFAEKFETLILRLSDGSIGEILMILRWLGVGCNVLGVALWYAIFSFLFEKLIWKLFRFWHKIPDLNGNWIGELTSSYDVNKKIPIEMKIKQTWSKISIEGDFPDTKSKSYSNVAAIYVDGYKGTQIFFGFQNDSSDMESNMQSYEGYNVLTLVDDDTINARYFNNRQNPDPNIKGGNKGVYFLTKLHECNK